jgi:hypothetical protein
VVDCDRRPEGLINWAAEFVYSLGLRRAPLLSEILNVAASDATVRTKALTFFLDNLSDKYNDYDPEIFRDLAFVPAVLGSEKLLSKPFEVINLFRS